MNYRIKESFLCGMATIIGLEVGLKIVKGTKYVAQMAKESILKRNDEDCFENE